MTAEPSRPQQPRQARTRRPIQRGRLPEDVFRWGVLVSATPVAFFLASIPVAFLDTSLAVLLWFGGVPLQILVLNRFKPAHTDDYFG